MLPENVFFPPSFPSTVTSIFFFAPYAHLYVLKVASYTNLSMSGQIYHNNE